LNAEYSLLKENYFDLCRHLNLSFNDKKITNKLKIGIYSYYLCNGGRARITSLLLNYLHRINIFSLYLFTRKADSEKESEYYIKTEIFRINMGITSIKNLNDHLSLNL
jgi:hypothetical protein